MSDATIIHGDVLEIMPNESRRPKMVFADPPDNLGVKYEGGFVDRWPTTFDYVNWLCEIAVLGAAWSNIFWLSYYWRWDFELKALMHYRKVLRRVGLDGSHVKPYVWWYTFGQHNANDNGSCFRPMMRIRRPGATIYPDAIREPSARQRQYNDKRADPRGRVPGDVWDGVWECPRVCGTFKEKRKWHKNQHPEALLERMVKLCCKPGDLVIDMFAGSGSMIRVCQRLGVNVIGYEISEEYCKRIAEETGATLRKGANQT